MELSQEENVKTSIRFLTSTNPYEQEYGLKVLINFTSKSTPGNKVQLVIFRVITINTFATLLCSTSEVIQMLTAWLLFHLTIADVNSAITIESGVVKYIVPLLQSDTDDVTEKALLLTTNLSLNGTHSHLLGGYGVVGVLTGLLQHSSPLIAATAAQPLRNLLHRDSCVEYEENQKLFCHTGGVKFIKEILLRFPPPSEELLQALTSVLHVLSIHNEIIRRIIAAAGLLSPLMTLMSSATTSHYNQELILKILTNLSLTPETEPAFITARSLPPLVDMLYLPDASFTTKHLTVTILANLSCNEQIREMLRYTGLSANLVELIARSSPSSTDLLEPAVIVVTNLAIDEFIRLELWDAGAPQVMTQLASSAKVPVPIREAARVALKNLSIPISEHVQALLRQQVDEEEGTIVETDDIADQTPIIPLPGSKASTSSMLLHPPQQQQPPSPTTSPGTKRNTFDRRSGAPTPTGNNRVTIPGSPNFKSIASPPSPSRDQRHVTPPPPSHRPLDNPSPTATSPSPHYTTSPPPPSTITSRKSPSFSFTPRASLSPTTPSSAFVPSPTFPPSSALSQTKPQMPRTSSNPEPPSHFTPPTTSPSSTTPTSAPPSIPSTSTPVSPTTPPAPTILSSTLASPESSIPAPPSSSSSSTSSGAPPQRPPREHGKISRVSAATLRRPVITEEGKEAPEEPAQSRPQLSVTVPSATPTESHGRARSLTKQTSIRRNHIAKEIFDTEQNYMRSLSVCIRMYLNPLLVNPENSPVPPEFVRDIFVNIQRIFKLTCEFLKKFKSSIAKASYPSPTSSPTRTVPTPITSQNSTLTLSTIGEVSFGELFLWLFNETKIINEYIEYINGFDTARLLIENECVKNSKFKDYLEKCRVTPECKGLTLQALLIMPVQRIPRHILLLTDLAKHTPPEHHDSDALTKAVDKTKEVAQVINAAKGRAESNTKMTLLQSALLNTPDNFVLNTSGRLLIKDGAMMMSEDKRKGASKYSYIYLFSDIVLFTRQQKTKYHFIRALPLVELKVVDIPPNETGQYSFYLLWSTEHDKQEKEFILSSTKLEEKEYWINGIKDAITAQKIARHEVRVSRNFSSGPLPVTHPLAQGKQ